MTLKNWKVSGFLINDEEMKKDVVWTMSKVGSVHGGWQRCLFRSFALLEEQMTSSVNLVLYTAYVGLNIYFSLR